MHLPGTYLVKCASKTINKGTDFCYQYFFSFSLESLRPADAFAGLIYSQMCLVDHNQGDRLNLNTTGDYCIIKSSHKHHHFLEPCFFRRRPCRGRIRRRRSWKHLRSGRTPSASAQSAAARRRSAAEEEPCCCQEPTQCRTARMSKLIC